MKYFQHDTNALENGKLWKVVKIHGMTGYGIWWALLEQIYQCEDSQFQIEANELWLERFADKLRLTDHRTLIRVLDTFSEVRLIDPQLWAEHTVFIPSVVERGDAYIKRKAATKERVKKHREEKKKELEEVKRVCNALQDGCNTLDPKYAEAEAEAESIESKLLKEEISMQDGSTEPSSPQKVKSKKEGTTRKRGKRTLPAESRHYPKECQRLYEIWTPMYVEYRGGLDSRKLFVQGFDQLIEDGIPLEQISEGLEYYCQGKMKAAQEGRKNSIPSPPDGIRFFLGKNGSESYCLRAYTLKQSAVSSVASAEDVQSAIAKEMKRTHTTGQLPDEWAEKTGKEFVKDLSLQDASAYLDYLRNLEIAG